MVLGEFQKGEMHFTLPDGSAILELMIVERADPIFSIKLSVASEEQALEMRSHWESGSESIYNYIWDSLSKESY